MNNISNPTDINAVLQQMRTLRAATSIQPPSVSETAKSSTAPQADSFGHMLKQAVGSVNDLQSTSGHSANEFVSGKHNDLVKVMVDGQKASIGFQSLVQVRNRMVTAYQDIMNMPI